MQMILKSRLFLQAKINLTYKYGKVSYICQILLAFVVKKSSS